MSESTQDNQDLKKQEQDLLTQDLMRFKSKSKELEEKLQQYEREKEEARVNSLKQKEEWQKVAEEEAKKRKEVEEKLQKQAKSMETYFKRSELRSHAIKEGIRDNAIDDLDLLGLDDISIETTSTGNINVLGADKYVERLKTTKPHWFKDKSAPNVNTGSPSVNLSGGQITPADLLKLQKEGKQADYEAALLKFSSQRKKG